MMRNDLDLAILDPYLNEVSLINSKYHNPFFVPAIGSEFQTGRIKDMSSIYKSIKILCLNVNQVDERVNRFYNSDTTISSLHECADLVTVVSAPFSIVYDKKIKAGLVAIVKTDLEPFNND